MSRPTKVFFMFVLLHLFVFTSEGQMREGKFGFGIVGRGNLLQSDLKTNDIGVGGAISLTYSVVENWGLRSTLGFNSFSGKNAANAHVIAPSFYGTFGVSYDVEPHELMNPFVYAGGGLLYYSPRIKDGAALLSGADRPWDITVFGGIGFDYFFNEFWSLTVSGEAAILGGDNLDGAVGGGNDSYGTITVGIRYYFFDKDFVKRMIEAFEQRRK